MADSTSVSSSNNRTPLNYDRQTWTLWYQAFKSFCIFHKAQWDKEALDFNFREQVKWDGDPRAPELKGPKPSVTPPAPSNVAMVAPIYAALMREHTETVDPSIYQSAVRECEIEEEQRAKEQPDKMTDESNDPRSWTLQMLLKGPLAIINFIKAVQEKLAPEWARERLSEVLRDDALGVVHKYTLLQYVNWLSALNEESLTATGRNKTVGLYVTLGGRSDAPGAPLAPRTPSPNTSLNTCPCKVSSHRHKAIECYRLRYCYDGLTGDKLRNLPSAEEIKETRIKLEKEFPDLKRAIGKKGWRQVAVKEIAKGTTSENSSSSPTTSVKASELPRYPGSVNACVISPELLDEALATSGIYTTIDMDRHPLSESTLLDNGAATHLVNSVALLEPGTFVKSTNDDSVEAGTSSLMVKGRGTRVFKGALHGPNGPNTEDLRLVNVAVVEGFNVNIISEARLLKAGLWYNGLDCTLRVGSAEKSIVLK
ncbi:hypothetical protein ACEPPN_014876 [Leptodophora sp. 'Broadleaf-Isolate-01']